MGHRLNMGFNRPFGARGPIDANFIRKISFTTKKPSAKLSSKTFAFGNHIHGADDSVDHRMGCPLCCVLPEHPTEPTSPGASYPTCRVGGDVEHGHGGCRLPSSAQCVLDNESGDHRISFWRIGSRLPRIETGDDHNKESSSDALPPHGSEREPEAKSVLLGHWQLCGDHTMDSPKQSASLSSYQNTDVPYGNRKNNTALSQLQGLENHLYTHIERQIDDYIRQLTDHSIKRLKEDPYSYHRATEEDPHSYHRATKEDLFSKRVLKDFRTMGITAICPIIVDEYDDNIWAIDSNGQVYIWNRMERYMRFIGRDIEEGIKNYMRDPKDTFIWGINGWVSEKENIRLARLKEEKYKMMYKKLIAEHITRELHEEVD